MMAKLGQSSERYTYLFRAFSLPQPYSSFVAAWRSSLKLHEVIADARISYAKNLNEMSNELSEIITKTDHTRKSVRNVLIIYF